MPMYIIERELTAYKISQDSRKIDATSAEGEL